MRLVTQRLREIEQQQDSLREVVRQKRNELAAAPKGGSDFGSLFAEDVKAALNDKSALAETPADSDKIMTTRHKSATALAPSLKALMFIAWGQLSMLLPQVMDGTAPLSNWSISFVGQGSVMLLLGFWLLLKD